MDQRVSGTSETVHLSLEILQDPRTISAGNRYLQVLNFPAYIGPANAIGQTVSDGGNLSMVDTSTSAVPSNIGSSIHTNTAEAPYHATVNRMSPSMTVPKSPPVARLPGIIPTAPDNSTDKDGKK
jgi:hypothetical protein